MPAVSMAPGIAAIPNIRCQLPVGANKELTRYASSWPTTIISVFRETMRPRTAAGTFSAIYIGTTIETAPTATPKKVRAVASSATDPANAHQMEPAQKITPLTSRVMRLPHQSATRPPSNAPMAAPTSSMAVTRPSSAALMPNSGLIYNSAPDITPVSYPKSRPPMAAKAATIFT